MTGWRDGGMEFPLSYSRRAVIGIDVPDESRELIQSLINRNAKHVDIQLSLT
jgi:hypothetical protein